MKIRLNKNRMTDSDARLLMDRFLDGETSLQEEKSLYDYFSSEKLPADLEAYRDMMRWYSDMPKPAENETKNAPRRHASTLILRWTSVAAIAAFVISLIGYFNFTPANDCEDEYALYEGSYIIRNGKKITDIEDIYSEIKQSEDLLQTIYSNMNEMDVPYEDVAIRQISESCADPEMEKIIIKILKSE